MDTQYLSLYVVMVTAFFWFGYPLSWNRDPQETAPVALLKILPILTLLTAVTKTQEVDTTHARQLTNFRYGLMFSLLGDIAMHYKGEYFMAGMSLFALALICYIRAFGFKVTGYEAASFCFTSGFVAFMFVLPGIKEHMLKSCVFIYQCLLMTNWWRTIVQWQISPTLVNLIAVFGAVALAVSDFIIGLDTFKFPGKVPYASVMIMITYYLAQLLMTSSVVNYGWTYLQCDHDLRQKKKG